MDNEQPGTRDARFAAAEAALGYSFTGPIKGGGHYVPLLRHGDQIFISGQVPRVGDTVVVTGRVGDEVSLEDARRAAQICAMRAMALLRQSLGSLDGVKQVLRVTAYVQCAAGFTQQSEVADAASDLLRQVLGDAGVHTRTAVGVMALPKNAAVELDLIAAVVSDARAIPGTEPG
jgi:enamine deaminase RidA (YjgF/YER057c/UK114 family)